MPAPITNVSPPDPLAARNEAASPSQDVGEEEFLNLLMTQLTNQDPMNPMDSAKFMEQIAALNSVQQLIDVNTGLDSLMMGLTSLNNQSAVDLVGKDVVARGNSIDHSGEGAHELIFETAAPAEKATVTIRNAAGEVEDVIELTELGKGEQTTTWAPPAGTSAGEYTFEVHAEDADGFEIDAITYIRGTVDELRFDSGVPVLVIGNDEVTLDGILRVLNPTTDPVDDL